MRREKAVIFAPDPYLGMPVSARAASVEDFYKGKTIQFVVGGPAAATIPTPD